jgi:hypothetical protein
LFSFFGFLVSNFSQGHLCSPRAWANCFRRSGDWIKDQWSMVGKQCAPPAELKRRLLGNKEQQGGEQVERVYFQYFLQ